MDETEEVRRIRQEQIEAAVQNADSVDSGRARLELIYGQVWSSKELGEDFKVLGFAAPLVVVQHKVTGRRGSLEFQHSPRFYFNPIMYEGK